MIYNRYYIICVGKNIEYKISYLEDLLTRFTVVNSIVDLIKYWAGREEFQAIIDPSLSELELL